MLFKFSRSLSKENTFFPENSFFLTFWHFFSNSSFWDAFYLKSALFNGFEKIQLLFHWNPSVFPKSTEILGVLRFLEQYYALRRIVLINYQFWQFWKASRTFLKKHIVFSKKNPIFEGVEESQTKFPLERLFEKNRPCVAALKKFRSFLEKTQLFSQGILKSERFRFENS